MINAAEEERFFARVDTGGECWRWAGSLNSRGYPQFWREGTNVTGRREAWELCAGERAPAGLRFETTCGSRTCVNPGHVRPVLPVGQGDGRWLAAFYARHLHVPGARCVNGHPLAPPAGVVEVPGGFACRRCRQEAEKVSRDRRRHRAPHSAV